MLDEADMLLRLGFEKCLTTILSKLPKQVCRMFTEYVRPYAVQKSSHTSLLAQWSTRCWDVVLTPLIKSYIFLRGEQACSQPLRLTS